MGLLVVSTNIQGLNTNRAMGLSSKKTEKASEKLSSGSKVNKAMDDAAGLAISEKMRSQIKGINMATKNASDGVSLVETAEGALSETHEMLKRMRELVVQGSNDTNMSTDRQKIGLEMESLINEIDGTADRTEYNRKKLINGDASSGKPVHVESPESIKNGGKGIGTQIYLKVGSNSNQKIEIGINGMGSSALGVSIGSDGFSAGNISKSKASDFDGFLKKVDKAISTVSTMRQDLGAVQNRLKHAIETLDISAENLSSSDSRIRDTDMAASMMDFTKANILSQAGTSMLTQANQAPNNILAMVR